MIIQCPECGTKYAVREEAIKPRGRTVRCASCGNQWQETGSEATEISQTEAESDAVGISEAELDSQAKSDRDFEEFPLSSQEMPLGDEEQATATQAETRREPHDEVFVTAAPPKALAAPEPEKPALALTCAILALSLAVVAVALLGLRQPIQEAWPATARLYDLAGLGPQAPGAGLALRDVHARLKAENGAGMLRIEGAIANTTGTEKAVPGLKAVLQVESQPPREHLFTAGVTTVAPNGTVEFATSFESGEGANGNVLLTFSSETMVK